MAGTATLIGTDDTTQGSWIGVYGADGFALPSINSGVMENIPSSVPGYATVTQLSGDTYDWIGAEVNSALAAPTTGNAKAIQHPDFPSSRFVVAMYSSPEDQYLQVSVGATTRRIAVYVYDVDNGREVYFRVTDGSSTLYQDSVSVANPVRWWVFDITGTVYLTQFAVSAPNIVVSAIMFDTPGGGGGTDTSLDVDPGEFTLTGFAAGFAVGIKAAPGVLVLSGSSASSGVGLVATPGTLALISFPAELVASGNAILDAQPGTLTLAGFPTGFAIGLAVTPSNVAISGQPATFSLTFTASPMVVALTGFPATLVASGDEPIPGRVVCLVGADHSVTTLAASDASVTPFSGHDRSITTIAIDVDC